MAMALANATNRNPPTTAQRDVTANITGNEESVVTFVSSLKRPRASLSEEEEKGSDQYKTLPEPTNLHIQLRFQLARFKNVYRIVRVPLNYTFANLHTLIQFVFGWNNSHLHQAQVYSHVQMYSGNYRKGEIKKCGRRPPMPTSENEDDIMYWEHFGPRDLPVYKVVKRRREKKTKYGFWDEFDPVEVKEDAELTLGEVWNDDETKNVSGGECKNAEIGIKYEYDLGSSWDIHITIDGDRHIIEAERPSNTPVIRKAKGAPPIEDASEQEIIFENDAAYKTVPKEFYDVETFLRYLRGEIRTTAGEEALEIKERRRP
ncbi:hypothetical protein NEOLEDRAFT_1108405 [Neolentinus lepideus HHB14362 ss-1]|uniref:Plasmid pRiA4b Orf3-like domain-containing protein n=1 Tax=Neolentinus lepideus HHB14362 ss-1 TaxID=1314782 RepID=A0A165UXT0_9AGAM|nr:hypothetical protein NEOLEDRAFT_1108405 [Neolentinus lepideus HHB14362 ss-1]